MSSAIVLTTTRHTAIATIADDVDSSTYDVVIVGRQTDNDVVIVGEQHTDNTVFGHRVVLAAVSPIFASVFRDHGWCANCIKEDALLILPDFDANTIRQAVRLLYSGEVVCPTAAEYCSVKELLAVLGIRSGLSLVICDRGTDGAGGGGGCGVGGKITFSIVKGGAQGARMRSTSGGSANGSAGGGISGAGFGRNHADENQSNARDMQGVV